MKKPRRKSPQDRWTRDTEKENYWKAQLTLWQQSGLSVRAFCKEHGIVETSFYAWRRELIIRAREDDESLFKTPAAIETPNTVKDGRGRIIPVRFKQSDASCLSKTLEQDPAENPFVPLTIVTPQKCRDEPSIGTSVDVKPSLIVTTPSGFQMTLSPETNLDLFKKAVAILQEMKC
jgi:transposase-like protein